MSGYQTIQHPVRFSSSTLRLRLEAPLTVQPIPYARVGDVVAVEVLSTNPAYPNLEGTDGSLEKLAVGDVVVGVIGSRQALRGFVGQAPAELEEGEELALLNIGGVVGRYVDSTTDLGEPARVRYLGTVVDNYGIVCTKRVALREAKAVERPRPIVLVIGTCMSVGKTTTMARLIEVASAAGHCVGAAKLSGVAAIRDLKAFERAGAVDVKSFIDCGLPSTVDAADLAPIVKTVVNALEGDLIMIELGDGIMGRYRVESVLTDPDIMAHVASVVVCASDLMAAYGAKLYLDELGIPVAAFSGLATENVTGSSYIAERLGVPAVNGVKDAWGLFEALGITAGVLHG
jgi:hypothetical protein